MACRLVEAGQAVESIVIIDTQPPTERTRPRHHGRIDVLLKLIHVLEEANEKTLGLTRAELETLSYEAQLIRLMNSMKSAALLHQAVKLEAIRSLVRVFAVNINTPYAPARRFAGEILLVQAQEPSPCDTGDDELCSDEAAEAWQRYAQRVVQVKIPGNHMTMLKRPNIDLIAARIRQLWPD